MKRPHQIIEASDSINCPDFTSGTPLDTGLLTDDHLTLRIESGRLIHSLPAELIISAGYFSPTEQETAFETDMIGYWSDL